jgi:DNA-directed RNA polymerase specialized sigma24 family protein
MMTGNDCDCLICRLEENLLDELSREKGLEEYRLWAASSQVLAAFPTASELIGHLHRQSADQNSSIDEIIVELVRTGVKEPPSPIWQSLLLLAFVPTIHRTTTQISMAFPSLAREDTAQHLFGALLEFLHCPELRSRRSHLAFAVARKMRRSAFRWAIRESHLDLPKDLKGSQNASRGSLESDEQYHSWVLLTQFLDDCERAGWLSAQERQLLTEFKLEGVTGTELALRSGRSAPAIHHRIQRLLERLRRIARKSCDGTADQLDLFRS